MNKFRLASATFAVLLLSVLFASNAHAVAFRTFVATTGADANTASNCGRATPCQHLTAAYSVTSAGGEIVALDSGGVGGLTITTAVTISSLPGETSFINAPTGTSGITVSAGATDVVVLRNLTVSGANAPNTTGVLVNSGNVIIRDCSFSELTTGVSATGRVDVIDSDFHANGVGLNANGEGADIGTSVVGTTTSVRVSGGNFNANTTAFTMTNPGLRTCSMCTGNKVNLWFRLLGNSSADYSTNIAGNNTFLTGSGTGCVAQFDCTSPAVYSGNTNPR